MHSALFHWRRFVCSTSVYFIDSTAPGVTWSAAPRSGSLSLSTQWALRAGDRLSVELASSSSSFRLYLLNRQQYVALDQNIGETSCCTTCVDPPVCFNAERKQYSFQSSVLVSDDYRLVVVCLNLLLSCDITGTAYVSRSSTLNNWNDAANAMTTAADALAVSSSAATVVVALLSLLTHALAISE